MTEHSLLGRVYEWLREGSSISARLVKYELNWGPAIDMPLQRRLWLWRHGFTSDYGVLLDVNADNYREFLSTVQHERAVSIAGQWTRTASNKLTAHLMYSSFSEHLPDLYGIVESGTLRRTSPLLAHPPWQQPTEPSVTPDAGRVDRSEAVDWIDRYLDERSALVLKPIYGRGGEGVLVCRKESESNRYEVNGETKTRSEFVALIEGLEEYLATEFVEQADYAEQLFPDAANTLRIVTYWDYETDEPFVGAAVQRIGTRESAPTDNWSKAGLSAEVSEDGTLSSGVQWMSSEGELNWFDTHPDTGYQIAGTPVPDWSAIREQVLEMASLYPHLPRVGWDILLTGDGQFKMLELNPRTGTRTIQVHRPLLRDPRIRRFYEHHDCL